MVAPQSPTSPKRSRGFSIKSDKSNQSGSPGHKRGLSESSEEKSRRNLHTKADPLVAMNELQPMAVALEKSNLGSLREIEHKDQFGNVISDPDLSNPTRPRLERPLDTIRSFEAAIYGSYTSNRASYARTDDAGSQMGDYSRRTSYYGGQNGPSNRNYDQSNYYGGPPSRPDSIVNAYQNAPQSPENPYQNGYGQNGGRKPSRHPRGSPTDGYRNNVNYSQYDYPQGNGQRSYDNVNAMSNGSGNTDSYGHSTDPSSMNSSYDQLQQQALQQQRLGERAQAEYGVNGLTPRTQPGDPSLGGPVGGGAGAVPAAAPPRKAFNQIPPPPKEDKRKSWFKRRFNKD
ncbi:hypothetical protein N7457_006162 [Penicillium paradoxum]|uniref:uncharacterized protein n=1 Tax=Penicillium paradoxum TaxID=176176 RepID=UPI0025473546|nr:uncharacterized protein N7457_006162 [Penicillium paradoxum]KAJ5781002.1 hypothetical protein N7457_006162 [Penicillium paradoxum]